MSDRDELQAWREWAQFVYLGNAAMDDAAMRAAVCAAHDAETDALRAERDVAQTAAVEWRDRLAETKVKLADAERRIAGARAMSATFDRMLVDLSKAERRIAELETALKAIARPRAMQGDDPWSASIARAALLSAESPR